MVKAWFLYAIHQISAALACAALILMLSEILIPGSVLPYFNLHILIVIAALSALVSPAAGHRSRWSMIARAITLSIISLAILGYAFLFFGTSVSGIMLLIALAILLLGLIIVLACRSDPVIPSDEIDEEPRDPLIVIEEVEIINETNVFMR